MSSTLISWQWFLILQPDPSGGTAQRVLRAPTAPALAAALTRSLEERWRQSFDQTLIVEARGDLGSASLPAHIRVEVTVVRRELEALVATVLRHITHLIETEANPSSRASDPTERHWTFTHAQENGLAHPPLRVSLQHVSGCSAWAAELALHCLGHPPNKLSGPEGAA